MMDQGPILCYKCGGIMEEDPPGRIFCRYCGRVMVRSPAGMGRLILTRVGEMPSRE